MLQKLLDDLRAVEDDRKAGALVSEALQAVKDFNSDAAKLRQEIAQRLRDEGLTYPEMAEILRVKPSRVPQILKGEPTGRWAKAARDAAAEDGE
ncbi:helix-turn-helix domain-containing protein [Spirillospora sp. NBC_00431]